MFGAGCNFFLGIFQSPVVGPNSFNGFFGISIIKLVSIRHLRDKYPCAFPMTHALFKSQQYSDSVHDVFQCRNLIDIYNIKGDITNSDISCKINTIIRI